MELIRISEDIFINKSQIGAVRIAPFFTPSATQEYVVEFYVCNNKFYSNSVFTSKTRAEEFIKNLLGVY